MADDAASTVSTEEAASQRAAQQASLRKQRREAKIRAGGSSRLSKITGAGGGFQRDPIPTFDPLPSSSPSLTPSLTPSLQPHSDPAEIDISQHFYAPERRSGSEAGDQPNPPPTDPGDDFLARLMAGYPGDPTPGTPQGQQGDALDPGDQLMRLVMQSMGGGAAGGGPGGGNPTTLPPQAPQHQAGDGKKYTAVWRIVHTVLALGLGLYVCFWSTFSGTQVQREQAALRRDGGANTVATDWTGESAPYSSPADLEAECTKKMFWMWMATEAALLTGRFLLLDGGKNGFGSGGLGAMLNGVAGMLLPPAVTEGAKLVIKYARWVMALRTDIAVVVFILGVCAWWRGS